MLYFTRFPHQFPDPSLPVWRPELLADSVRVRVDIFHLRQRIIDQYAAYTRSFLTIHDSDIREYVDTALADGRLWPDALLQLSPAYEQAEAVADLVGLQLLHPLCGEIFRAERTVQVAGEDTKLLQPLRLFRHQKQAIDLAAAGKNFVVTTGTGSGKSLTYILPIVNHILNHAPEQGKVRAIIVYPMNALINSQEKAIKAFFGNVTGGTCPEAVCSAMFSGQLIGMSWEDALDSALADQLQVLSRDEQRALLAYLRHAADPEAFVTRVKAVLNDTPVARQRGHLGLLRLENLGQLSATSLGERFLLGQSLRIPANGAFERRLEAFVNERGL